MTQSQRESTQAVDQPVSQDNENAEIESNYTQTYESFDDMNLKSELLHGIYGYGYETPSEIQKRAIVPITTDRDVIAQAQSGTGKTATFSIGLLQTIDPAVKGCQTLVLAPTRELAMQSSNVVSELGKYLGVSVVTCIGGIPSAPLREALTSQNCQVVVGTPGRVFDMIKNRFLSTTGIRKLILDEADEMLSQGFKPQIYDIFQCLSPEIQVILLSATIPAELMGITKQFMRNPIQILVKNTELTLEGIKQYYIDVDQAQFKYLTLTDLYNHISVNQAVIFCNHKNTVNSVANMLKNDNFTVSAIHGDMTQDERTVILKQFRAGETRVLLTTDLLSRGIDVQQVSLVINYDMPANVAAYLHRIGRSGRFGRKGIAINFVTREEKPLLAQINSFYHTQIEEMPENIAELFAA